MRSTSLSKITAPDCPSTVFPPSSESLYPTPDKPSTDSAPTSGAARYVCSAAVNSKARSPVLRMDSSWRRALPSGLRETDTRSSNGCGKRASSSPVATSRRVTAEAELAAAAAAGSTTKVELRAKPCWPRGPSWPNWGKHTGMPPLFGAFSIWFWFGWGGGGGRRGRWKPQGGGAAREVEAPDAFFCLRRESHRIALGGTKIAFSLTKRTSCRVLIKGLVSAERD